jgi:hypothetical protein
MEGISHEISSDNVRIRRCLVSSLAFADNPTDVQLMPNDGSTTAVQQENRASHKRRSPKGKDESLAPNVKSVNPAMAKGQSGQSNPEYRVTSNSLAGNN